MNSSISLQREKQTFYNYQKKYVNQLSDFSVMSNKQFEWGSSHHIMGFMKTNRHFFLLFSDIFKYIAINQ